jgi:hypothetical protein
LPGASGNNAGQVKDNMPKQREIKSDSNQGVIAVTEDGMTLEIESFESIKARQDAAAISVQLAPKLVSSQNATKLKPHLVDQNEPAKKRKVSSDTTCVKTTRRPLRYSWDR